MSNQSCRPCGTLVDAAAAAAAAVPSGILTFTYIANLSTAYRQLDYILVKKFICILLSFEITYNVCSVITCNI